MTDGTNMIMPVAPTYGFGGGGNNGFGDMGSGWWILLLFVLLGGWGNNGYGGGMGMGGGVGGLYPWMNQSNQINDGFRDQMLNTSISAIQNGVNDLSAQICNSFAQAEIADNGRQIANMQQMFGLQSQFADCCCENRLGIADLRYTVATENCADRTQAMQNTRDIIDSQTRGTQAVLDKLCQLELDGVRAQVDAKNDRIAELQTQLNMANLAASQVRQTTDIQNSIINELRSCPIPAQPVYGSQPIFTCNNNGGGCGCGGF